jgi:hypothetical protein
MRFAPKLLALTAVIAMLAIVRAGEAKESLSDDQVAAILIRESIQSYSGNCPCPYNLDKAGRKCGKRSAYLRPGGEAPLCYRKDVTRSMIEEYRNRSED